MTPTLQQIEIIRICISACQFNFECRPKCLFYRKGDCLKQKLRDKYRDYYNHGIKIQSKEELEYVYSIANSAGLLKEVEP